MTTFAQAFETKARAFPKRNALFLDGRYYTYEKLDRDSDALAALVSRHESRYVLLFCAKSYLYFAGALACLKTGKGYTCINDSQSKDQVDSVRATLGASLALVDQASEARFHAFALRQSVRVDSYSQSAIERQWESSEEKPFASHVTPEDCAYVFCTSGSTGVPKVVPITHRNLMAYLEGADERYTVDENDRFLQNSALTFDVSTHEILYAWFKGACVYGVTTQGFNLVEFIREHGITFWSSVPSISRKIIQMKQLSPGCMPSLRHTMWVGEPLPASIVAAWKEAAPQCVLENMYGPTEATVGITGYRILDELPISGIVPIGDPYKGQKLLIVDENGKESDTGELLLGGSQVFAGYLNNPAATEKAFAVVDGERWYRTGDRVRRSQDGDLHFLCRIDDQLKINGYRFERAEVEERLRKCAQTQLVAVLPLRGPDGLAEGTVAFLNGSPLTALQVRSRLKDYMPAYMWPKRIETKVEITFNQSHKTDYKALKAHLEVG